MESEKATERFLIRECKRLGGVCRKWTSPGHSGVPDRICIFPYKHIFFVEVKSKGDKPTSLQKLEHRKLRSLGFNVYVPDTKEEVKHLLQLEGLNEY